MAGQISFNLLDNPWVPCKMKSNEYKILSLKDVLFNSQEIFEITSENPLIVVSLYRFFLAILHRNFGPKDKNEWIKIYEHGSWDKKVLEVYFKKWHHKFELFNDPLNRFYQIEIPDIKNKTPITKLNHALSSGNNTALFDHNWDSDISPLKIEDALQLLIAYQNYAVGGGRSSPYNFSHAPLISGIIVILKGDSLFETLMLNFIRYDENHPFKKDKEYEDLPFWERNTKALNENRKGRNPYGYLDYLTWQSRRIWLVPFLDSNEIKIKDIYLAQGEKVHSEWNFDPQMVYKQDKKNKLKPVKIKQDKQVWREIEALLRLDLPNKFTVPKAIDWIADLDPIPYNKRFNFEIYGLCNDPKKAAKLINWQRSSIPLSVEFISNQAFVNDVKTFIDKIEKIQQTLSKTLFLIFKDYLYPEVDHLSSNQQDNINSTLKNYQTEIKYWNFAEKYFYKFLGDLTEESQSITKRQEIIKDNVNLVLKMARKLLDDLKENNKDDPRALKAYIQDIGYFHKHVYKI